MMLFKRLSITAFFLFQVGFSYGQKSFNQELKIQTDTGIVSNNSIFLFQPIERQNGGFFNKKNHSNSTNYIYAKPIINSSLGFSPTLGLIGEMGGGILVGGKYKKFSGMLIAETGLGIFPGFIAQRANAENHLPGRGYLFGYDKQSLIQSYTNVPFVLQFEPSKYFKILAGNGKHFLGNGYRSMLLSDFSRNYGFAAIETKIWNLKYVNLFSGLYQDENFNSNFANGFNKYSTAHYLTWDITNKLSISAFETVIWRNRDTLVTRGFDPNYLNPIIFYRPVEYSTGSSDNVLMGVNVAYQVGKSLKIYGQLIIDEFLLSGIRADVNAVLFPNRPSTVPTGWWANKHAGQAGVMFFRKLKDYKFFGQAEFNYARPYTFSHLNMFENYGQHFSPLGHPLGANFSEILVRLVLTKKKWFYQLTTNFANTGIDNVMGSWGGNINRSYANRPMEYGHVIGQGDLKEVYFINAKVSYLLNEQTNMRGFAEYGFRFEKINMAGISANGGKYQQWFSVGISTKIFNNQNNF